MHNLTKIVREYSENTLKLAQEFIDEGRINILQKNGRGIKASVSDQGEEFIVYVEFGEDLSIANTICSCDSFDNQCIHKAAVLLFIKQNYLRAINKYKRDNMKDHLLFFDYFEARDFLVKGISNQTIKKNQIRVVLLDNKKFRKDQRAALFSLCFANYLHVGNTNNQFNNLLKVAVEIIDEFIKQDFFTQKEIENMIYDAVTLFDQNEFNRFINAVIKNQTLSPILQNVLVRTSNSRESCCLLLKEQEKNILKGEVIIEYETLLTALQYYNYAEYVSFKVYNKILKQAVLEENISYFNAILFFGFLKYHEIDKSIDDENYLFVLDHYDKIVPRFIKMLKHIDVDQMNAFLIYLIHGIAKPQEVESLRKLLINALASTASSNAPLLLFAIKEDCKYEIIVNNSNYRQVCQMIEFAHDDEKQYLTTLIMKRLENNFIDCVHEFETNYEIELLLKTHQEYVQMFLERSLQTEVDKKRRFFYLTLARKYGLIHKVGLHIFEGN